MPLDKIYDRIEEDLRNQYNLGYTPDQTGAGYHKIRVTAKARMSWFRRVMAIMRSELG